MIIYYSRDGWQSALLTITAQGNGPTRDTQGDMQTALMEKLDRRFYLLLFS